SSRSCSRPRKSCRDTMPTSLPASVTTGTCRKPPSCIRRSASMERVRVRCHHVLQNCVHRVLGLCQHFYRVPAGEDPEEPFLFIGDQYRADAACLHLSASLLNGGGGTERHRLLASDDLGHLAIGHVSEAPLSIDNVTLSGGAP